VLLRNPDEAEEEEMHTVALLVGAADVSSMAAASTEGLATPAPAGATPGVAPQAHPSSAQPFEELLKQLREEPSDDTECSNKFKLYEGYAWEVGQMRDTLFKFYDESWPNLPTAVQRDMENQMKSFASREAMGIPDDAREWFVFHMMRQAERNNMTMVKTLDGFEKKLAFLAANEQLECPVCFDDFQGIGARVPETLACCHKVCGQCWANWSSVMHGRPFCPLCRHEDFLGAVTARVTGRPEDFEMHLFG
jgi:hypothetical protein